MLRREYFLFSALSLCAISIWFLPRDAASSGAPTNPPQHRVAQARVSPSEVMAKADARLVHARRCGTPIPRGDGSDKTLAPYFAINDQGDGTERLPLKETSADIRIAGVIAQVVVRQVFENTGNKPIEATYVFPASTRAAVHGMRMRIGNRTIEAKIDKKEEARAAYEQARREGKRASLLEQQRPNVFTMSVANIMPKDRIEVELDYSELLVPENATYEFVYPTVVGPRYGGGADPNKDKWIANPYLTEGAKEPYRFSLKAHLETGIALKEVSSPSHKLTVDYRSPQSADIALAEPGGGNRDFVLRYRLSGDQIESGALVYEGQGERFFVLMVEPPAKPKDAQVPPREYVFLLDVSGSMHGFPLDTTKELMRNLFSALRPTDYFNVVLFSGSSAVMNREGSLPATPENINRAISVVNRQQGGGGTELLAGLREAYGVPKLGNSVSRSIIVVTDGYVGVEAQAFKLIRDELGSANLFAFGIGSSVNRGLIEGMARAGLGEPFVVLRPEAAISEATKLQEYIQYPVLTHITARFNGVNAREVAPSKIPDLLARRPLVLFGKLGDAHEGTIELRGTSGGGVVSQTVKITKSSAKAENAPLRYLWARKWVEMLDDEMAIAPAPEIQEAITDLGLSYNLLTRFTSFVAVDSEVVNRSGETQHVKQPLPLPEGVSNQAVGGASGKMSRARVMSAPMKSASVATDTEETQAAHGALAAPAAQPTARGVAPEPAEKAKETKSDAATVHVVSSQATNLTNPASLVALVQKLIRTGPCPLSGRVVLLITVDATGKVIRIEARDPASAAITTCLTRILVGQNTDTRASGGATGTLQIVLEPTR